MILQSVEALSAGAGQLSLTFFQDLPVVVEPSPAMMSSDGGLLVLRQFDERLGITQQFCQAIEDRRAAESIEHSVMEMVRARIYGILADYVDQNDHDTLRRDPVFKLLTGRSPDGEALASQPTLSRFENMIMPRDLFRMRDVLIDQFIASFSTPPRHLTFDVDAVDDPTHGEQQLTLFHGYFKQYQYFPAFTTCAENDQVAVASLRHGTAHAAFGLDDDLEYLVTRLRAAWPDVHIHVRGDAGCGVPWMYAVCERLRIDYSFGLSINPVLRRKTDELLARAVAQFTATGEPQRLFTCFEYQAGSWPQPRLVIAKAEAHAQGTNRRFVVSNRPGAPLLPSAAYDEYANRGESENRNKELKCELSIDRLSDHRFMANYFRLYLHVIANNLLVRLRREVADPPPLPATSDLPVEALAGADRKRYERLRRQRDPLGEGQACTWRSLLIKVAARITVSARRVLVQLSGSWPHLHHYFQVARQILASSSERHFSSA